MDCLSPEQMARYLRGGGNGESRAVEAHVRDCPACAMGLLLARETFVELKVKAVRPASDRFRVVRRRQGSWIPWAAAAAVVLAAIFILVLQSPKPEKMATGPKSVSPAPKQIAGTESHKSPEPPKKTEERTPQPELPKPPPEPKPKPELPEPKPEPKIEPKPEPKPEPPVKPPEPPKPEPEPKKAAPTVVERSVVAKVTRTVGGNAAGKAIRAGETLSTARSEFVEVAFDGYGSLYFRENSRAELGANGEINLVEGEMFARIDNGRRLGALKTPSAEVELQAAMFDIQVTKMQTEVSVVDGRAAIGSVATKGPSALLAKTGKAAEIRPLDPGFASWIPEKLAARKFTGWFEGESFTALQGFKAMDSDGASGRRAAVQTADQGTASLKTALPFKGHYALWLRVRAYEAKAPVIGLYLGGQSVGEKKIEPEGKGVAWRWVGPISVTSDRLDLAVAALSRWPLSTQERASFPVVLDVVYVTSAADPKAGPPERLPEERRAFDFVLDEPAK